MVCAKATIYIKSFDMKKTAAFLIALMAIFCATAQRVPKVSFHRFDDPYYGFAVFSTGDTIAYSMGNGSVVKSRVFPRNWEEEKCAAFANGFSVVIGGPCGHFYNDTNNKVIKLTIRCITDQDYILFPHMPNPLELDSNYCLPPCNDLYFPMGGDSVLCVVDKVMKDILVYRLRVKRGKAYMDSLVGQTDDCGTFQLKIPSDRDSYYGFYLTDEYIEWVHFFRDIHRIGKQKYTK